MKFLALQTDVELLKKQFIPEGEHEIVTVTKHPIKFFVELFEVTVGAFVFSSILFLALLTIDNSIGLSIRYSLYVLLLLTYAYQILKSYIAWRYNFLIVTSEKIIIINQRSFLHQDMNSIHLDNIRSSRFESQFFGIFRCGVVSIDLHELEGGSTQMLTLPYIPAPDTVASAIEHGIFLKEQRKKGTETPKEQEKKAEVIKESLQQEVEHPPTTPEPPPTTPASPPETPA